MRKERALFLFLLTASVLAPIFFFAAKFSSSYEERGFVVEDISAAATKKHSNVEPLHVESTEQLQAEWDAVKEPAREILEDGVADGNQNQTIRSVVAGGGRSADDLPVANGVGTADGMGVKLLQNATSLASVKEKLTGCAHLS